MMNGIYSICEAAVESIVSGDYTFLREQDALSRVSDMAHGCRQPMKEE